MKRRGLTALGLFALIAIVAGGRSLRPDLWVAVLQPVTGALGWPPTHIPRSLSRVKPQLDVAWTPDAIDALAQRAVAAHSPLRPLYQPSLYAFDLPTKIGLQPTDVVADIGCGTGAFEIDVLERNTAFARLYAVDIDPVSIDVLTRLLAVGPWGRTDRVVPVLAEPGSFGVPPGSIDVLLVDTVQLHQPFDEPDAWKMHPGGAPPEVLATLHALLAVLKPGGRLNVVENLPDHPLPPDAVRIPYEEAGFVFRQSERLLEPATMTGAWYLSFVKPET